MANARNKRKGKHKDNAKAVLVELLNSSPFNLRPGNNAENRAIGQALDPNLTPRGKLTPLSQSLNDLGAKHGILSPPKGFIPGANRHPDNVDKDAVPAYRSSTSVSAPFLQEYEREAIELWSMHRPRKYAEAAPFHDQPQK